jgi:hypothetical protein
MQTVWRPAFSFAAAVWAALAQRLSVIGPGVHGLRVANCNSTVSEAGPAVRVADFGVAKAIWRNDTRSALRELGLAMDAGTVPVMMMGQLRAAAEKLPAAKLRAAMDAVFRTDLALKSSGGDARVLLERLVVELSGRR